MALLDLSFVTRVLVRLLEQRLPALEDDIRAETFDVSALPPDQLNEIDTSTLGLYLYHVVENAHARTMNPAELGPSPISKVPMGLTLYYQLSAHAANESNDSIFQIQKLFGLALKTLHDFPELTADTRISAGASPLFDSIGVDEPDKPIRLSLAPVEHSEAANFWSAGSSPLRAAAYYQAEVVLLEPEEPTTRSGRVLSYGIQTFVGQPPRLDGSENVVTFELPDGGGTREVTARPAQVPFGGRVTFTGTDLEGDETKLLLSSSRWDEPQEVGEDWRVTSPTAGRLSATIQQTIKEKTVLPGLYSAEVRSIERRSMPDGSVREFKRTSNETPFSITPRIDDVGFDGDPDDPDRTSRVRVDGYIFQHSDLTRDQVRVYVGSDRLSPTDDDPAPGEYKVESNTEIRLRLPDELPDWIEPGDVLPVRILINGVESSPPSWISVP